MIEFSKTYKVVLVLLVISRITHLLNIEFKQAVGRVMFQFVVSWLIGLSFFSIRKKYNSSSRFENFWSVIYTFMVNSSMLVYWLDLDF